jgi:alpha/beta superfamily hydrolase
MDWNETPAERARASAEQPVIMQGEHGKLYSIFTPPSPEVPPAGLCVILLGRNRWFGDRLSVKGARWLAARGFSCLRFDYHGYGESEGDCKVVDADSPYTEDALTAIRHMRSEFAQQRFVLSGFCFDGRTALSVVEHEGESIEAIVLVAVLPSETASMYSRPEKANRGVAEARAVPLVSENFKRDLRTLLRSRVQCLFLYGSDDIEYHNFQLAEHSLLAKLQPAERTRLVVEVWPGRVHVAEDSARMRELTERALLWIDSFRQKPCDSAQPSPAPLGPDIRNGFRP